MFARGEPCGAAAAWFPSARNGRRLRRRPPLPRSPSPSPRPTWDGDTLPDDQSEQPYSPGHGPAVGPIRRRPICDGVCPAVGAARTVWQPYLAGPFLASPFPAASPQIPTLSGAGLRASPSGSCRRPTPPLSPACGNPCSSITWGYRGYGLVRGVLHSDPSTGSGRPRCNCLHRPRALVQGRGFSESALLRRRVPEVDHDQGGFECCLRGEQGHQVRDRSRSFLHG